MKSLLSKTACASVAALIALSTANAENSFQEASQHIDLDGPFIAYLDFDGDGQAIGEKLNVIYQDFAAANPDVPPFPLDFPVIFEALGFGSLRAWALSSSELDDGLVRNKSVSLLDGAPKGLMALNQGEPIAFDLAKSAPADAATVISGNLNLLGVQEMLQELAGVVMGPMGDGMLQQGLSQPIPGSDVLAGELITALSGRIDLILGQDFSNLQNPKTMVWTRFADAGALVKRLEPALLPMQISFVDTKDGRTANLSHLVQDLPIGLFVHLPKGSDDLVLYTDEDWVSAFAEAEVLAESEAFQRVASKLPAKAQFYGYSGGFDLEPVMSMLETQNELAQFAPLIRSVADLVVGDLLKPSANATYLAENALVTEMYSEYSYKDILVAVPAGIGAGFGVAGAIKASLEQQNQAQQSWSEDEATEPSVAPVLPSVPPVLEE
ncbi:hypothetical protein [Pelagicoccus sp. SDUM812003]|uniref:hypothetical protein n=1 Tax=Pelagicoccus sp. SDUM812003 TaxID=3041267 RepID=UPI00280D2BD4|nr:hypothetical protein [Pelagicoccus sp. SDUM812003]MDQ8204055.1 hypothetical protein [Pelagicoccus sp. SDUM812003]